MSEPLPAWLVAEVDEFVAELPADEQASARAVWDAGEYIAETWPCNGIDAWSVDLGVAELLTAPQAG